MSTLALNEHHLCWNEKNNRNSKLRCAQNRKNYFQR
jgi:hypothetical protein